VDTNIPRWRNSLINGIHLLLLPNRRFDYISCVSAQEIIEEIKHLPRAERSRVTKFVVESEMAEEIQEFERAFAGGSDRPETEEEIQRVEAAVKAARNR
jgi:hypothetical protein